MSNSHTLLHSGLPRRPIPNLSKRSKTKSVTTSGAPRKRTKIVANGAGPGPGRVGGKFLGYFQQLVLALDLDPVALLKAVGIDKRHLEDTKLTLPGHCFRGRGPCFCDPPAVLQV